MVSNVHIINHSDKRFFICTENFTRQKVKWIIRQERPQCGGDVFGQGGSETRPCG